MNQIVSTKGGWGPTPRKAQKRRDQIIDAAIDFLSENDLGSFTFDSVGKRVGMSRSLVAHYFPVKEDILQCVVEKVMNQGLGLTEERQVSQPSDWKSQIQTQIIGVFSWIDQCPKYRQILLMLFYLASVQNKYRKIHERVKQEGIQRLSQTLESVVSDKEKTQLLAQSIQTLINGALLDLCMDSADQDPESIQAQVLQSAVSLVQSECDFHH